MGSINVRTRTDSVTGITSVFARAMNSFTAGDTAYVLTPDSVIVAEDKMPDALHGASSYCDISVNGDIACSYGIESVAVIGTASNPFTHKFTLSPNVGAISQVKYNVDGSRLAVIGYLGVAIYITSVTPYVTTTFTLPPGIAPTSCAFSPDGDLFVVGATDNLLVYDASSEPYTIATSPAQLPSGDVRFITFNPSGTVLSVSGTTAGDAGLKLYSVSGTTLTIMSNPVVMPTSGLLMPTAFSGDGTIFALVGNIQREGTMATDTILFYDTSTTPFTRLYAGVPNTPSLINISSIVFHPTMPLLFGVGRVDLDSESSVLFIGQISEDQSFQTDDIGIEAANIAIDSEGIRIAISALTTSGGKPCTTAVIPFLYGNLAFKANNRPVVVDKEQCGTVCYGYTQNVVSAGDGVYINALIYPESVTEGA